MPPSSCQASWGGTRPLTRTQSKGGQDLGVDTRVTGVRGRRAAGSLGHQPGAEESGFVLSESFIKMT